ncbi:putative membrane protein YhhN [Aquimarina sp. EL_43]|uniref:lysoplasmalogenase n=1 Tax=Aquimarina TaxID=290174 RepID=UPI00046FE6C1|nr:MULTISPECIES: lysoplasmalogenase [Aquimarina]MBG6130410.1 putative membrane protein YhhN [Aquimarina sp. EL_35]MBG6149190.1 putative membrane protein YhhN [Aquimarina sp. EL_32]MBG6168436.1 putative membrane protein YhhN [Aquimarina sp. EL_43]
MSKKTRNQGIVVFVVFYIIIVICDLVCSSNEAYSDLRNITKPSILGSLIIFFLAHRKGLGISIFRLMILALLFSLAGDILLLFVIQSQLFFIAGLVMFLLAHVMYILVFLKKHNKHKKNKIFLMLTVAYGAGLFYLLYPGLGDMLIPVMVYMIVILLMSNASYLREKRVSQMSFLMVFIGSLFFMISDSILAFTMFYQPLPMSNIWIMTTYATAQLLIVCGVLRQKNQIF